jgi:hypothetical protein
MPEMDGLHLLHWPAKDAANRENRVFSPLRPRRTRNYRKVMSVGDEQLPEKAVPTRGSKIIDRSIVGRQSCLRFRYSAHNIAQSIADIHKV